MNERYVEEREGAAREVYIGRGMENKGRRKSRGDDAVQVAGCPPCEL